MSQSTTDAESVLASYQPSEAAFELTESLVPSDTPLDPTEKNKSGAVPYSYVETSSRMLQVVRQEIAPFLSSAGVVGMVTNVSHGTFYSRPSSLLIFSFSLRSGQHGFRFKNANVKINFSKHSTVAAAASSPSVAKFAPRKIFGLPTVEGRKNTISGELTLQVPAGLLTVGPSVKGERETEYEKQYRFKTIGNFWSSKMGSDWDIVYWDMRENKRTKEGIPDRLNVAVVIEAAEPFVASVEVTVDTPFASGFLSHPWKRSNPAVFVPGVVMGGQPRTTAFDELTPDEWKSLIPYEEEWEGRVTDAAEREGALRAQTLLPIVGSEEERGEESAAHKMGSGSRASAPGAEAYGERASDER
ncbi:hypothetical protein PZA11_003044 [Diplocarpon coronariae]|uniref:Uncharacterized protein n=1 Tax=Diplocarpon coronariae TaxID=2795749 RepID=A0A218Z0X6_9HELO|nr:hypothetical protein B2J93_2822 [Marssonina coronariae]